MEHSSAAPRIGSLETSAAGVYEASPWGNRFHHVADGDKPIDEVLGAGSAGPGKSVVLLRDPLFQMQREHHRCSLPRDDPHWIPWGQSVGYALLLRRTTPMIEELVRQSLLVFPKWDPGAKFERRSMTWVFKCGYRYQFGHCNELEDWERYMGNSKTWLGFDELIHFEKEQYDNIKMWVRASDPVLSNDLRIRCASNPVFKQPKGEKFTVSNPYWVREYFVEPYPDGNRIIRQRTEYGGETFERTRMYMPAKLTDNPDPVFRQKYMAKLVFALPHVRRALIEGDWYSTPGGYFENVWDPDVHVIEPFHIPPEWPRWRSMDWGYKTPGVVLWIAMDPDENMIIYREFNFQEMVDVEVAENIKRIESDMGMWYRGRSLLTGPADTQIWEQRGERGLTKAEVFRRAGIPWVFATKERIANGQAVAKRLADHSDGTTSPGLMVFRSCQRTIQFFPNIAADQKVPEMPVKGGNDHHFDTVCYGVRYGDRGSHVIQDHEAMRTILEEESVSGTADYGTDGYGGA